MAYAYAYNCSSKYYYRASASTYSIILKSRNIFNLSPHEPHAGAGAEFEWDVR